MKLQNSSDTGTTSNCTLMCTNTVKWSPTLHVYVTVPDIYNPYSKCRMLSAVQLREPPEQYLTHLCSLSTLEGVHVHFSSIRSPLELIVTELNSLQIPFARAFPISDRIHVQMLSPVITDTEACPDYWRRQLHVQCIVTETHRYRIF